MKNTKDELIFDLHMHSHYSDGGCSLQQLFDRLHEQKVVAASITDHNHIEAYQNLEGVQTYKIALVKGMECNVGFKREYYHILMYDFKDCPALQKYLKLVRKDDVKFFKKGLRQLKKLYRLKFDRKKVNDFIAKNTYLDKVRLNNFLVEQKLASSGRDAFYKFTKPLPEKLGYIYPAKKFFALVKKCGAISILAHPNKYLAFLQSEKKLQEIILQFKAMGLDGIEVFNNRQTKRYEKLHLDFAKKHGFEWSGGSDFHKEFGQIERKKPGCVVGHNLTAQCYSPKLAQLIYKAMEKEKNKTEE